MQDSLARPNTLTSTEEMLQSLDDFLKAVWAKEPADIKSLREMSLPPMGNMPCVLYASFNLFWLGEALQVWRSVAQKKTLSVDILCIVLFEEIARHSIRLSKWKMTETLQLVQGLCRFFRDKIPNSHQDCEKVLASSLLCVNRIQNWIDSVIPWSRMDQTLGGLRQLPSIDETPCVSEVQDLEAIE